MDNEAALRIIRVLADGVDPDSGEVLASNSVLHRPEVIRALNQAICGLQYAVRREKFIPPLPCNAGKAWSRAEEEQVCQELREGKALPQIAAAHGRTVKSILVRLVRLGKIAPGNPLTKAA